MDFESNGNNINLLKRTNREEEEENEVLLLHSDDDSMSLPDLTSWEEDTLLSDEGHGYKRRKLHDDKTPLLSAGAKPDLRGMLNARKAASSLNSVKSAELAIESKPIQSAAATSDATHKSTSLLAASPSQPGSPKSVNHQIPDPLPHLKKSTFLVDDSKPVDPRTPLSLKHSFPLPLCMPLPKFSSAISFNGCVVSPNSITSNGLMHDAVLEVSSPKDVSMTDSMRKDCNSSPTSSSIRDFQSLEKPKMKGSAEPISKQPVKIGDNPINIPNCKGNVKEYFNFNNTDDLGRNGPNVNRMRRNGFNFNNMGQNFSGVTNVGQNGPSTSDIRQKYAFTNDMERNGPNAIDVGLNGPIANDRGRNGPNGNETRRNDPNANETRRNGPNGNETRRNDPNANETRRNDPNANETRRNDPNANETRRNDPNANDTGRNGPNRGWENSINYGHSYRGRGRRNHSNFSLLTRRKYYREKTEYKSETDSIFTSPQAPKVLIMKEDMSPYSDNEINQLRELLEDAILKDSFNDWAPKFEEGNLLNGIACEIICLSKFTASWILSCDLGKINDKQLRVVRNGDMPNTDFNALYKGKPRLSSDFLKILAKQNPDTDLNIQSWFVTDSKEQSNGNTWVAVKMSHKSASYLVDVKKRDLYYGPRIITFYEH